MGVVDDYEFDWGWTCPFCGEELSSENHLLTTIMAENHMMLHEEDTVEQLEEMLRGS